MGISSSLCALDDLNIDDIDVVDSFGISSSLCALDSLNIDGTGVDEVGFKPASLRLGLCTDLPAYIDSGKIQTLALKNKLSSQTTYASDTKITRREKNTIKVVQQIICTHTSI